MIIVSQNKRQVIPFDRFVFSTTRDGRIVATPDIIAAPSEFKARTIAKYSSVEKAEDELNEMVRTYRMGCSTHYLKDEG